MIDKICSIRYYDIKLIILARRSLNPNKYGTYFNRIYHAIYIYVFTNKKQF
jgi:hypothetical protein